MNSLQNERSETISDYHYHMHLIQVKRKRPLFLVMGLLLCTTGFLRAANPVTFQVDMSQVASFDTVYARGSFNNFDQSLPLTNNGAGVYTGTVSIASSPGTVLEYKYFYDPGANWENPASTCGNNRIFTLAGGPQVLPVVYYNDQPPVLPDNNVTFQIDMTGQISVGSFTNGDSTITVSGGFNGWGVGTVLTNDSALAGNASNIYSGPVTVSGVPGACFSYKFRMNNGWESPASTEGDNRSLHLAGGDQVLPLVFYNDDTVSDLLPVTTTITFRVDMTGALATDSHAFDNSADRVFMNGDFLGWPAWNNSLPELTNNPVGSSNYSITLTFPRGHRVANTYKYSINGPDNEAPSHQNHIRFARNVANYTLPLDKFGNQYHEPSFGQLTIGGKSGANVPLSWLGRPGVHLQTSTQLAGGWQDRLETDGTNWTTGTVGTNGFVSSTNYPVSGSTFFRLIKPK